MGKGGRCSLCGGRLQGNRCTQCGLDNSKTDAYRRKEQKHVHSINGKTEAVKVPKVSIGYGQRYHVKPVQKKDLESRGRQPTKKNSPAGMIIFIVIIIFIIIGALSSLMEEQENRQISRTYTVETANAAFRQNV